MCYHLSDHGPVLPIPWLVVVMATPSGSGYQQSLDIQVYIYCIRGAFKPSLAAILYTSKSCYVSEHGRNLCIVEDGAGYGQHLLEMI